MPTRVLVALCALLLTVALAQAGASGARRRAAPDCRTLGTTVAANEHMRIYHNGEGPDAFEIQYWACPARARRGRYLTSGSMESGVVPVAIGGRYAIFDRRACPGIGDGRDGPVDRSVCRSAVAIYDARSGRVRHVRIPRAADGFAPYLMSLVVNARGWGGWVEVRPYGHELQSAWLMPPGGAPRKLAETDRGDYGEAYDNATAINAERFFWTLGGVAGVAPLRR